MSRGLLVDAAGDLVWPPRWSSGHAYGFGLLLTRLSTPRGQHPTDTSYGLPWLEWYASTPETVVIEAQIRNQALREPVVTSVDAVTVTQVGDHLAIAVRVSVAQDGGSTATREIYSVLGSDLIGAWSVVSGGYA